ncbi:type II toxin-antitoxin system RelE/ParE family toxin [Candidatus Daviesbacteria bacterium]|nr:type II toxin-antitoxin system RelE/ParE family toxin [Candidatus Daviesbacteria bacterium]
MAQIIFTKTAEKSFLKLPIDAKKKIAKAVEKLADKPLAGEKLKGEFAGQYKLYAWPYRVIYIFSAAEKILTVVEVEHRQGVYK